MTSPASAAHHTSLQPHHLLDLDLGDDRGIGGEVLVAGKAEAAALPAAGRQSGVQPDIRAACSTTARARGSASTDSR